MNDYTTLEALLEQRLAVIADTELRETNPEKHLQQLQQVSEDIMRWTDEAKGIPQQLNHFLKQSSLSKALDYLKSMKNNESP